MFGQELTDFARNVLTKARAKAVMIATAESCTGGLIAGLLTEIPGSSDVFDRGFVTYSNQAKAEMLGVSPALLATHGAVSEQVAAAMVQGALTHSHANVSVAVTGVAGPGGGSADKPVGLVYIAVQHAGSAPIIQRHLFGDVGRMEVRLATVQAALSLLHNHI